MGGVSDVLLSGKFGQDFQFTFYMLLTIVSRTTYFRKMKTINQNSSNKTEELAPDRISKLWFECPLSQDALAAVKCLDGEMKIVFRFGGTSGCW